MAIEQFLQQLKDDIKDSLLLTIGAPLEQGKDVHWSELGFYLLSTALRIIILLAIFGFFYWLAVYVVKHVRHRFKLSDKTVSRIRSGLRYLWLLSIVIIIMSQTGVSEATTKATARATIAAGFYYILFTLSTPIITRVLEHYGLNQSIEQLLRNIISVLIVIVGIASVMAKFGFDIVSVVAGLGIVGLAVGFAAQSTLANFIAGITILLEQSFHVGDWVRLNNKEGKVLRIALRTTHIRTRDNVSIIIPNSTVASSEVINLTARELIRFDFNMRIGYEEDIETARNIIKATFERLDITLQQPAPTITVKEFSDTGLVFIIRYWLSPSMVDKQPKITESLNENIKQDLAVAGIHIPYPRYQLSYLEKTNPTGTDEYSETDKAIANSVEQSKLNK